MLGLSHFYLLPTAASISIFYCVCFVYPYSCPPRNGLLAWQNEACRLVLSGTLTIKSISRFVLLYTFTYTNTGYGLISQEISIFIVTAIRMLDLILFQNFSRWWNNQRVLSLNAFSFCNMYGCSYFQWYCNEFILLAHLNSKDYVRFQSAIAVLLKIQVFLDVTLCQFVNLHVSMVLYSEDFSFQSLCSKLFLPFVIVHFISFSLWIEYLMSYVYLIMSHDSTSTFIISHFSDYTWQCWFIADLPEW